MKDAKAVVVLSGGQDSATCLLVALKEFKHVSAVSINYGQRHGRELLSAALICAVLGVKHTIINMAGKLLGTSPLVNPSAELEHYTDPESMDKIIGNRIELTFVPLRNPVFLLLAANHAIAAGADTLYTGVCAMDNANYPDCTPGFIESVTYTINEALGRLRTDYSGPLFTIYTPLLYKTKAQTVELAMSDPMGAKIMELTHTCYTGVYPPCGKCHACVLRADGFQKAGVPDPLVERANSGAADPTETAGRLALGTYESALLEEVRRMGREPADVEMFAPNDDAENPRALVLFKDNTWANVALLS